MPGPLRVDVDCGHPDPGLDACVASSRSSVPSPQPLTSTVLWTKTVHDIVFSFTTDVYTVCGVIPFLITDIK